jgi:predicted phage-related endonuclease
MTVERREILDRQEWLNWRKPFITASQVPALFGAHPYLSALKLYLEKSGVEFSNTQAGSEFASWARAAIPTRCWAQD